MLSTDPVTYILYRRHCRHFIVGAASSEVNEDVVEDSFLQGRHIGVHVFRLTADIFMWVIRYKFVHHSIRQWPNYEDRSGDCEVPLLYSNVRVDLRILMQSPGVRVREEAGHVKVGGELFRVPAGGPPGLVTTLKERPPCGG